MSIDELSIVELPLVQQLQLMGWEHVEGSKSDPSVTGRSSFREVLLIDRLRAVLRRINVNHEGDEWLDEDRVSQSVSALEKVPAEAKHLVEANQHVTGLLFSGISVPGVEGWDGGRERTVDFIDWESPENNEFVVVNQFRVDEPGGQAKQYINPDVVLFVNGIPLVVIEAKSPHVNGPIPEAIRQLRRYSNQRGSEKPEGNEQLFWSNQFMVATCFDEARVGTFTAEPHHYLEWKDTAPVSKEDVAAELGKDVDALSSQELLVAGMLRPANLLDLVRHFCVFDAESGTVIKKVARYQQFRGVRRTVERLKCGDTRLEDGEFDRRGGVIWHTQGSGKSLTMVFLVRKMRSDPELRKFKVVVITDRTDLQNQLSATADLAGETVEVAKSSKDLRTRLSVKGPGLVFAMIQKYLDTTAGEPGLDGDDKVEEFPVLNEDESILVVVDEAHRSHTSALHANLLAALPNCARVGLTGTPIIMGAKKRTHEIFGPFIDTYTITESEADGSTVPILYEGRTADAAVKGASDLDEVFEDLFGELTDEQRERLQAKYATKGDVLEAPELIARKAADMLEHYVSTVMPGGFKGMVVATSRQACIRYRDALLAARDALVAEIEALPDHVAATSGDDIDKLGRRQQFLVRALPRLELLKALDFKPVISGAHNDDPGWAEWTDPAKQNTTITAFKKKRLGPDGDTTDPTALLIVKSMLLTGFDVPRAQVLYLDRSIREAELLQAVARVNRPADHKAHGLVVDYFGISRHLTEALAAYSSDDIGGAMHSLIEEIERLEPRRDRIRHTFVSRGAEPADTPAAVEECVQVLADQRLRVQFEVDLKRFLTTMDVVLPRPEALPYIGDAKLFGRIQIEARRRYRDTDDGGFDPGLYQEKVRQLIDEHITVLDLTQAIPPLRITDIDFPEKVNDLPSDRAKASEMEHALRHHIRRHADEDPVRYRRLSERLNEILDQLGEQWDQLVLALTELISESIENPEPNEWGLDPVEQAVHGLLTEGVLELGAAHHAELAEMTREIVHNVRADVELVGFWGSPVRQNELRTRIKRRLDESDMFAYDELTGLSDRLLELARANQHRLAEQ